jgi:parvulin-like peptidyl-prolyl isomerase
MSSEAMRAGRSSAIPARARGYARPCAGQGRAPWLALACALAVGWASGASAQQAAPSTAAPSAPAVGATPQAARTFATVGEQAIPLTDYQRALQVAMRERYYHAKPPEGEYARFQREVGADVVNRVLLLAEARRRGLKASADKLAAAVAGYDQQYGASANWRAHREAMLAAVLPQLEGDELLAQLSAQVRAVEAPDEATAQAYHGAHRDLFTEPEQLRLSVILLRVDPRSPQAAWNSAQAEAQALHARLVAGEPFDELARLHSADRSAANGGRLEGIHRGMLPEAVQAAVDALPRQDDGGVLRGLPALAEPVQVLEGWLLLRLDERQPARERAYAQVRERVAELWRRDESQARWNRLIDSLRRATPIRVDESLYAPLPAPADKAPAG